MVHILLINKLAFPIQQVTAGKKNKRATTKIHRCMSVCGFVFFLCVYEFQQRTDFCNDLYHKKQIVKKKKKQAAQQSTMLYSLPEAQKEHEAMGDSRNRSKSTNLSSQLIKDKPSRHTKRNSSISLTHATLFHLLSWHLFCQHF